LAAAGGLIGWTYVGYPVVMGLATRRRSIGTTEIATEGAVALPRVTVLVPALNEAEVLAAKLADLAKQDYPPDKVEVIVVADGSTDDTVAIARQAGVRVLWSPEASGKAAAVNRGVAIATGDVVCLTDANCALATGSLRAIVAEFAQADVAVVGGAKTVIGAGARGAGEGLYWRMESFLKSRESRVGAAMGVPGEICAFRRTMFRPIPPGVINDDYHLTCDALIRALHVRFAPGAVSVEEVPAMAHDEFERRARIAAGTWQTTINHLALADPRRGLVALAFLSHRVLRSIVVPLLLPVVAVVSIGRARTSLAARMALVAQGVVYGSAAFGSLVQARAAGPALQFVMTNTATLVGAGRLVSGRQPVQWRRVQRGTWVSR
jgi:cellulose synthase/poly-beta-1,6-N-acetylglucosamine synthase-like glycosyltransferase